MKVKKLITASLGVVLVSSIFLLSACGETEVSKVDNGDKKTEAKADENTKKKENKVFKIGDTVKVNDVELTITKASYTDPAPYTKAEKGKVLTIELKAKNSGDTQAFVDNTDFNLYDKDGNKLKDYFGYDEMAVSGELNKGKQLTGKLYFDVPQANSYELVYTPAFSLDSKEIKWNIEVK
ncbi:uncharacterized protein DUF4352 [Scopulibacillus darangshiensis]|uniref:Uncharacterized protein DUF4352 n=1 Tax=Scopulibacillus darangshiensis TaxID=442528 RepID=A0A4R2NFA9_9BACL|nr:DUF4352 domain-containing protein [Scopulibacillus darangshiensis]TCP19947.1 uncharacterized protein DUF4352 [Scopulibacillus darangshiensis]